MSVLVGHQAPDFTAPAVSGTGEIVDKFNLVNENRPLQFLYNENYGYLLLENNLVDNIEQKQIIFKRINEDLSVIGFTNDDFVYNMYNNAQIAMISTIIKKDMIIYIDTSLMYFIK
mgnify:CR=1 FL=1